MGKKNKVAAGTKTIDQVFAEQDASDMFFNNEIVTNAYKNSIKGATQNDLVATFLEGLVPTFGEENSKIIAKDFLARV